MDGQAILAVGTAVGGIGKFLVNAGLRGIWATVAAFIVTIITVAIFAYSKGDFAQATAFNYFAGFAATLLTAGGIFHGLENAKEVKTMFTGTGDSK